MIILNLSAVLLLAAGLSSAQEPKPAAAGTVTRMPEFVALAPNINDFGRFADGGPDENWYIGSNNAWIVQLPPAPIGEYSRAFIGAKIGRAKTRVRPGGRLWDREPIPGKVYIGISPTPSFSADRSFFLAETADIPLEADPKVYSPGAGQSQWFWAEVPSGLVSFTGPNYLIVWSPTNSFNSSATAPILAALEDRAPVPGGEPQAWNNRSVGGVAPRRKEGTLETPIHNLKPALAIKLIAPNDAAVTVHECSVRSFANSLLFRFSAEGESIDSAWLEISQDQLDWEPFGKRFRNPPFHITVPKDRIPLRGAYIRAAARDMLGNEGACDGMFIAHENQARDGVK